MFLRWVRDTALKERVVDVLGRKGRPQSVDEARERAEVAGVVGYVGNGVSGERAERKVTVVSPLVLDNFVVVGQASPRKGASRLGAAGDAVRVCAVEFEEGQHHRRERLEDAHSSCGGPRVQLRFEGDLELIDDQGLLGANGGVHRLEKLGAVS